MVDENTNTKTAKNYESETYRQQSSNQWRTISNNVWHNITSKGYWANFLVSLIFLFITPFISLFMNNYRFAIIGVAIGLTLIIWTLAIIAIRQIPVAEISENPNQVNNKPTLEQPTLIEDINECFFSFGGNTATYPIALLETQPMKFISINGLTPEIYIKNHKFYVDVLVSDPDKLLPVQIKEGKLTVTPENWDTNSNLNAFEVVDEKLDVVFQIIYHKPSKIFLYGVFPDPQFEGELIFVSENGIQGASSKPADFTIKRHFKYPSWKYPGQFDDEIPARTVSPASTPKKTKSKK